MNRRKWLWTAVLAVPAALVGGFARADAPKQKSCTCPAAREASACPGCCRRDCCRKCAAGTKADESQATRGKYVCPLTGEKLCCQNCCPLNKAEK